MDLTLLYEEFENYPLKAKIEGCPCCELDDAEEGLHRTGLKNLNWDDLGLYIFKAITTFGDEQDFKHFLPRIFELYITEFDDAPYDVGVLFSKLEYAKWRTWPINEKNIIFQTIHTWLGHLKNKKMSASDDMYQEIVGDMDTYKFNFSV